MVYALCHICKVREDDVEYCSTCGHWFCGICRGAFFRRGLAWLKEFVGGKREGCCGPED